MPVTAFGVTAGGESPAAPLPAVIVTRENFTPRLSLTNTPMLLSPFAVASAARKAKSCTVNPVASLLIFTPVVVGARTLARRVVL